MISGFGREQQAHQVSGATLAQSDPKGTKASWGWSGPRDRRARRASPAEMVYLVRKAPKARLDHLAKENSLVSM